MNKSKLARNLWILAGFGFLIASIINLQTLNLPNNNNKSSVGLILNIITCILCFVNAYLNHKKIDKDDKA